MPTRQVVVSLLFLAACGSDSSGGDAIDAGLPVVFDAGAECSAEPVVDELPDSTPGGNSQAYLEALEDPPDGGVPTLLVWSWVVSGSGDSPDYFTFTLDRNKPYALETSFDLVRSCNSDVAPCWTLETDVVVDNEGYHPTQTFFPEEGTLVLHEVSDTRLRATFSGARFQHYLEGPTGFSPASDHDTCVTVVEPTIELDFEVAPATAAGKPRPMR